MLLTKIVLHNYAAFDGTQVIDLTPTTDSQQNIVLIGAMNGSGKTSLLEAVKLCLFGEKKSGLVSQRESERVFIEKRLNYSAKSRGETEMSVTLTLDQVPIPDSHKIEIRRVWRFLPVNGTYDTWEMSILKDGKELQLVVREQWQDFINEKIPPGIADFFFFDGEKIQQLADDSTDRESLRDSIKNLLGLQALDHLGKDISKNIDDVRREADKVTDSQLRKLEADEAVCLEQIHNSRERIVEIQNELYGLDEYEERIEKEVRRLTNLDSNSRVELERAYNEAEINKRGANEEILKLASDMLPFAIAGRIGDELRGQITAEHGLRDWEASKTRVHPQLDKIVKEVFHSGEKHPTPDITPQQRTFYASRLTEEWEALFMPKPEDAATHYIHELSPKDERFVLGNLDKVSKEIIGKLKDLLTLRERASRHSQDSNRRLRDLPEDDTHIGQMMTERKSNREKARNLNEQTGKLEDELKRFERELISIREKISNLKDNLDKANKARTQVELARRIQLVVRQYEKDLQISKLAELERHTTEMYQRLARKIDFVGEVKIDLSTFDVSVHDIHGVVREKRSLSAGEKQIYAISLLWGLAKTSDVELPIIIDTPFARLDSEHRTNIAKHYFPYASEQVVVLSTDEEIDHRYVKLLQPYIGKSYLIKHDDAKKISTVEEGYF
jgi:DNA sulfur modification protein DndD